MAKAQLDTRDAEVTMSRRRLFEARDLVLGGTMGALALVLPIAFHALGPMLGPVFLPMYYPILALGLLASWEVALIVAIVVPLLSAALTGMPPVAMVPLMAAELIVMAVVASLLRSWRLHVWPSALLALIASRAVGIVMVIGILPLIGITRGLREYAVAGTIAALPGIAILLTVVPAAVYAIERTSMLGRRSPQNKDEFEE